MFQMAEPSSYLFPIADHEHLVSAWVRLNLRSGMGYLPFDQVLRKWNLPKRHIQAQRPDEMLLKSVASHIRCIDERRLAYTHTAVALWELSVEMDQRLELTNCLAPARLEHTTLAFNTGWQLCPRCAENDKEQLGYSFWHRNHQLPSVAHCYIHGTELLSCDSLRHMSSLTLPASWHPADLSSMPLSSELQKWSRFVLKVDRILLESPEVVSKWRSEIWLLLGLPKKIRLKDRSLFDDLSTQFEAETGYAVLSHLFKAYRDDRDKRPNILWTTLYDRAKTVRHPVYWLVILFWLRFELNIDVD